MNSFRKYTSHRIYWEQRVIGQIEIDWLSRLRMANAMQQPAI